MRRTRIASLAARCISLAAVPEALETMRGRRSVPAWCLTRQGDTPVATGAAVFGGLLGFIVFGFFFLLGAGLGQCSPTICRLFGLCGGLGGGAFGALLLGGLGAGIDHLFVERSTFFRRVAPCLLGIVIGFVTALVLVEVAYSANVEALDVLESPLRTVLEQWGYQDSGGDKGMLARMLMLLLGSSVCGYLGWRVGRLPKTNTVG